MLVPPKSVNLYGLSRPPTGLSRVQFKAVFTGKVSSGMLIPKFCLMLAGQSVFGSVD
ncbi:MAG: hypothetical protein ACLR8Y_15600 [Alistipes indistinctus]